MSQQDIDKAYVSPYDKFLYTFDRDHAKSESQLKEISKHQRIAEMRDNAEAGKGHQDMWENF